MKILQGLIKFHALNSPFKAYPRKLIFVIRTTVFRTLPFLATRQLILYKNELQRAFCCVNAYIIYS